MKKARQPGSASTPCLVCGYDLAGLPAEGACPECNAPIKGSLEGDLLRCASPRHLERLHLGACLMLAASVLIALSGPVHRAIDFSGFDSTAYDVIKSVCGFILVLAMVAGWWRLTSAEPAWREHDLLRRDRQSLRSLVGVIAGLSLLATGIAVWAQIQVEVDPIGLGGTGVLRAFALLMGARFLLEVWAFFVAAVFLLRLSRRIGPPQLVRAMQRIIWSVPLVYAAFVAAEMFAPFVFPYSDENPRGLREIAQILQSVLFAIAIIIVWVKPIAHLRRQLYDLWREVRPSSPTVPETQTEPHPEPPAL